MKKHYHEYFASWCKYVKEGDVAVEDGKQITCRSCKFYYNDAVKTDKFNQMLGNPPGENVYEFLKRVRGY